MKRYLLIILISLFAVQLNAQEKDDDKKKNGEKEKQEQEEKKDKWFFGGSVWAQFGTITQVEVAPMAGYHITPRLDLGIGARYVYYRTRSDLLQDLSAHIYGGSIFTRFVIIEDLANILPMDLHGRFISHLEYEGLNMPSHMDLTSQRSSERFWTHNYLVGGGLQQQVGKSAYLSILILYNLNEKSYSLYNNPIIRIGVTFR